MKEGPILTNHMCEAIYFVDTKAHVTQDLEEYQQQILDFEYSRLEISGMVNSLDIPTNSKLKQQETINKFTVFFGGGLGHLKI